MLDSPEKFTPDDYGDLLLATASTHPRGAEQTLVELANQIATPGTARFASADRYALFCYAILALRELRSGQADQLVFDHFDKWTENGRIFLLRQLIDIGWPSEQSRRDEWTKFIVGNIDYLSDPDVLAEANALVDSLKNARETGLSLGRRLRIVAKDAGRPMPVRTAAEQLTALLERNNGILVTQPGAADKLQARLARLGIKK